MIELGSFDADSATRVWDLPAKGGDVLLTFTANYFDYSLINHRSFY